jgi:CHAD domain-containing protein
MAKAREVPGLTCDDSFRGAAGKVLWTRFDEMMSYQGEALKGEDIEGVHDMRVASRRLRAALEIFRDVFSTKQYRELRTEIKLVADALGRVRDLDVLEERLEADRRNRPRSQQQVLKDMLEDLQNERASAREGLKDTIKRIEETALPRRFLGLVAKETT